MKDNKACGCACGCACRKGSKIALKIVLVLAIFAAGAFTGKHCMVKKAMKHAPVMVAFNNGCLDMSAVKCPKKLEALTASAENSDNCISMEEYKAMDKKSFGCKKSAEMKKAVAEKAMEAVSAEMDKAVKEIK